MKKVFIIIIFVIFEFSQVALGQVGEVNIGDELTIKVPSGNEYQYIFFPRKNIIIKRGGIPNLKMVKNLRVVVTEVEYNSGNKTLVTIKRKDGSRFFKCLFHVKAELESALESGELSG